MMTETSNKPLLIRRQLPLQEASDVRARRQHELYQNRRQSLLGEVRGLAGGMDLVSAVRSDEVYRIVWNHDGARLYRDAQGHLKGVFYKNGRIAEHARLEALKPSAVRLANAIGAQFMLVSIAMQLNRVESYLHVIHDELRGDRLAEIDAGLQLYLRALELEDIDCLSMVQHAMQTLTTGLEKVFGSLKRDIAALPDASSGFFDNWWQAKSVKAEKAFRPLQESLLAYLRGTRALAEMYAHLGAPALGEAVLREQFVRLMGLDPASVAAKARLHPATCRYVPEEPWLQVIEVEKAITPAMVQLQSLENRGDQRMEMEVLGSELLGGGHERV